jgi:hypothetical protein
MENLRKRGIEFVLATFLRTSVGNIEYSSVCLPSVVLVTVH